MQQKIIVGLGNPGEEYEDTYHNIGQMAVSMLAKETTSSTSRWKKEKNFEYLTVGNTTFVKPLTFMNESGKAVQEALKKFGVKPEDLTVVHDDSDLIVGNYKLSFARSSAGHKGVQSIIDTLGTNEFHRIRIGIRAARELKRKKAGEFALKQITKKDLAVFQTIFTDI